MAQQHVMELQNQQRNNLMAPLLQWRYNKCQNWIQQKTNDLFLRLERDSTLDEIVALELKTSWKTRVIDMH